MNTFAVLQLSGCAGCEVSLLNTDAWSETDQLVYMPLVISSHDVPEVHTLLVSGGVRRDEDLFNLRRSAKRLKRSLPWEPVPSPEEWLLWGTGMRSGNSF